MYANQNFDKYVYCCNFNYAYLLVEYWWTKNIYRFDIFLNINNGILMLFFELLYSSISEKSLNINIHHKLNFIVSIDIAKRALIMITMITWLRY